MIFQNKKYFLQIPIVAEAKDSIKPVNFCGIDPGVRTLLTTYGDNGIEEYQHNDNYLKSLYNKISILKSKRSRKRSGFRKKQIRKVEKRIKNTIDTIHWKCINNLVKENDIIYFGDIKSHSIVKNNKNKTLNRELNGLKFYKFKQRLQYKCLVAGKKLVLVNEFCTTKTCSKCGTMNHYVGKSETFYCVNKKCQSVYGRDINAAKNIFMKGILQG